MVLSKLVKYDKNFYMRAINDEFRRKEAVKLYREILRTIRLFTWTDENGVSWADMLRVSTREEFESSKEEKDPQVLAQALVNARLALDDLQDKYRKQQSQIDHKWTEHVEQTRVDRNRGVNVREHELFDRQFNPLASPGKDNPLLNLDLSQFSVHQDMMTDRNVSYLQYDVHHDQNLEANHDQQQSNDIYATAMKNLRNRKR